MKQVIITLLLSIVSIAGYSYDFEVDGICYNIQENGNEVYVAGHFRYPDKQELAWISDTFEDYFWNVVPDDYTYYKGDIVVPSTVTYEGNDYTVTGVAYSAFHSDYHDNENPAITSIVLPSTIKVVEEGSFKNNTQLEKLTLESVQTIKDEAFHGVDGVKELNLRNVTTCGSALCMSSLEILHFPKDMAILRYEPAKRDDYHLKEVVLYSLNPKNISKIDATYQSYLKGNVTLIVPDEALETYKAHPYWGTYNSFATHSERGISSADGVAVANDCIKAEGGVIVNNSSHSAEIYNTFGRFCGTIDAGASSPVPARGFYIVVSDNQSKKVFIK